ncbi:TraB/GumN family protein [Massilia sp. S19_KUP03_FR1]|uniref:TraB/GumN family protein n=1 Tax=Massilia sp. S19_KUP03_FR1 TaxID=3025503 RepID=UPI002FCDD612
MRQKIVWMTCLLWLIAVPSWAVERGALFKVTGQGHTQYLFGTMHVGLPEFYPLEARIVDAVKGASTLALEIDPAQPPEQMAQAMVRQGMIVPGGAGYERMAPARRAQLDVALKAAGVEAEAANVLNPAMVAALISLSQYQKLGYRPEFSADAWLAQLARRGKTRVVALETVDGQLGQFNKLTSAEQWHFLDESLDNLASGEELAEARGLVEAWAHADRVALDALVKQVEEDTSVSGKFMRETLLDGRNGALADKLAALLQREEKTVGAIGMLHLLGKRGVPALLQAKGYRVERVY